MIKINTLYLQKRIQVAFESLRISLSFKKAYTFKLLYVTI